MSVFKLDTDVVSNSAGDINSIAAKVVSLGDSVSSYDTSGDFSAEFNSAKNVIAQNLEACATKIYNTATYMNSVVNSHMQFQKAALAEEQPDDDTSQDDDDSGSGVPYYVVPTAMAGATTVPIVQEQIQKQEEVTDEPVIEAVSHVTLNVDKMSDESKKLLGAEGPKYKDGYAVYGERTLVACDASIGKVGDVIRVTKEDGSTMEFVVGANTYGEKYKNKLNFIVEKDAEFNEEYEHILRDTDKIENCGNVGSVEDNEAKEIKFVKEESMESQENTGDNVAVDGEVNTAQSVEGNADVKTDGTAQSVEGDANVEADGTNIWETEEKYETTDESENS